VEASTLNFTWTIWNIKILTIIKLLKMKRYKVTFNYFESGKKRIGIRILEAYDKEHAMQLMSMWPKLILKVETL
jgi:hypothetical protein